MISDVKPLSNELEKHKIQNNKDVESEVQPPNPIPPDSQPNKLAVQIPNIVKDKSKEIENKIKLEKRKQFDSHPKNISKKYVEANLQNPPVINGGVSNVEPSKETKLTKPPTEQEKLDIVKQQKLIETIKQHGEEQKELIKEQKEILDELKKTKEELKTNHKENIDTNDAKKIAVESIQKIADMAIKSLSGVSDKPQVIQQKEQKDVQEIAKKAVETIAAIQETGDKVKHIEANKQVPQQAVLNSNVNNNPPVDQIKLPNAPLAQNSNLQQMVNMPHNEVRVPEIIKPPSQGAQAEAQKQDDVAHHINNQLSNHDEKQQQIPIPLALKPMVNTNNQNVPAPALPKIGNSMSQQNINNVQNNNNVQQNNVNNNINQINNAAPNVNNWQQNHLDTDRLQKLKNEIELQKEVLSNMRQKREVVDCTEKDIKEADKLICDALVKNINNDDKQNILPAVDLAKDMSLRIPVDSIHHGRSLKSVDEEKAR